MELILMPTNIHSLYVRDIRHKTVRSVAMNVILKGIYK